MGITEEGTAEEYSVCSEIVTCKCGKEAATVKSKTYSHLIKTWMWNCWHANSNGENLKSPIQKWKTTGNNGI